MQEPDGQLLTRYATDRDEAAFKTLADRHLGLIYHVALRRTGNRHLAEEISQNVLCAVVRKAAGLARHPDRFPAWLHRATVFESSKAMRSEASHQRRKELLHPDSIPTTGSMDGSIFDAVLPLLDVALDRLPDSDRRVVLGHFIEGKSFQQIGGEASRPAATVQKQCRRALEKLARTLQGKGVTLSAAALATGLSIQSARAAPPALLKSAAGAALAGAATHSTASLTCYMAMKSKATVPLALLLLVSPLVLQEIAISRTATHNDRLRTSAAVADRTARLSPSMAMGGLRDVGKGGGRITIDRLHRARLESHESGLKQIAFDKLLATLDAGELEALIPQATTLPVFRDEKTDLFASLIAALAKLDPGKAVRSACTVELGLESIVNAGVDRALFTWASARPEEATDWLADWLKGNPDATGRYLPLTAAVARALILIDSPRAREVLTGVDDRNPGAVLGDAISGLRSSDNLGNPDAAVAAFAKFLPWIREFIPEHPPAEGGSRERAEVTRSFLLMARTGSGTSADTVPDRILREVDLLPTERRLIAEAHARRMLGSLYGRDPDPDRRAVEAAVRNWLAAHFPEAADEVLLESMSIVAEQERQRMGETLRDLAGRETLRDSDVIERLERHDFREFPDLLPLALDQARRIKDAAKRVKLTSELQHTTR